MKLKINDQGIRRIARALKGQEIPEPSEGGSKPKVLKVKKYALGSSSGEDISEDELFNSSGLDKMMEGVPEASPEEVLQFIQENYGVSADDVLEHTGKSGPGFLRMNIPESVEKMDIGDIEYGAGVAGIGVRDNTYNWSWWGPTAQFTMLFNGGDDDPYNGGILLLKAHMGGDVRGGYDSGKAYKLDSYAEQAPWYAYRLTVSIDTDKGNILLDSEDDEAYYFSVDEDQTGTFNNEHSIKYDDLMEALEWGDNDIW